MPNAIDFEKNLPHWLRVKLAIHRLRCGKRNGINYVDRVWVSSFLNMSKPLQHNLQYSASLAICHFANLSPLLHSLFRQSTKAVSTLMRFQKYAGLFFLSSITRRFFDAVLMRFRLPTLKRSKTIELHVVM